MFGNKYLALVGAIGTINKQVKVYDGKKLIGNYRAIKSFLGSDLAKNKIVDGKNIFDLYVFNRKL
jgi:hypothetical protein